MTLSPSEFADHLIRAMVESDMAWIDRAVDRDIRAYITNETGGSDVVTGHDAFMARFPDFASMAERFSARITQLHEIDEQSVMVMVEIEAARSGMTLHNFAACLLRITERGTLIEYRMVEALPQYSDRFWGSG